VGPGRKKGNCCFEQPKTQRDVGSSCHRITSGEKPTGIGRKKGGARTDYRVEKFASAPERDRRAMPRFGVLATGLNWVEHEPEGPGGSAGLTRPRLHPIPIEKKPGRRRFSLKSSRRFASLARVLGLFLMMSVETCFAQALPPVRGQYTPGVSAINSGVMPEGGLTYANYFLDYSFDKFVTARGDTVFEKGEAATFKDVNVFEWVFAKKFLGADFAVVAGVRFSSSSLTSARLGALSGGGGFADFSLQPPSLGWHFKRADFQVAYVFFAPTGRFVAGASDNIGSGFWTNSPTAGETLYLTRNKRTAFSAYQMYEFHTAQEGSNIHPGETMDLDYSLTQVLPLRKNGLLQFGVVGYGQWQTTNNGGPGVNPRDPGHYRVNAIGGTVSIALPVRKKTALGFSLFQGVLKLINRPGIFASDYGRYHVLAPPSMRAEAPLASICLTAC